VNPAPRRLRALLRLLATGGALVLALVLAPPAPAAPAAPAGAVAEAYARHDAQLPPCEFSAATLAAALRSQTPDQTQYGGDFTLAIQGALAARAAGSCRRRARGARGASSAASTRPGGPVRGLPRSITAPTGASAPAPLVALGALTLLLALMAGGVGLARLGGWQPPWMADWRQACGEASLRLDLAWHELADRFGRGPRLSARPPGPKRPG
jgi:hypothetical protein